MQNHHVLPTVLPSTCKVIAVFVIVALPLILCLLPLQFAHAQAVDEQPLTILITASRIAETVDETLSPVTVITRREIEDTQASTVEEVLQTVPGVVLSNSGGVGKLTSLFLRGTESRHVLVLIDGVKVGSATTGTTQFEHLPLDQIERIEIVRGPRSSLYGAEAIGGVVQIFTRKGSGKEKSRFSVSTGSHNTRKVEFGVGGGTQNWYNFGASAESTDGFNACTGNESSFRGCAVNDETDADGYANTSVHLRGGTAITEAFTLEGNFLQTDSETEFDGSVFAGHESDTTTQLISAKAEFMPTEQWRSEWTIAQSENKSDSFCHRYDRTPDDTTNFDEFCDAERNSVRTKVSTFNTQRKQASWQNDFLLSETNQIVTGVDYVQDKVDSSADYAVDSRDNTGVFGLWKTTRGAHNFEVSLRHDDNEQFGTHATGSIAWGGNFANDKRLTASYGTAFAAPTFDFLYFPNAGNPNLDPERSKSFNLGLSQSSANATLSINLFHTNIDDLIANDENFRPQNISEAEISGLEVSGTKRLGASNLSASFTMQNPVDASGGENNGNLLARRAQQILNIDVARRFGKHLLGATLFSRDQSYDNAGNTVLIASVAKLSIRGEIKLHPHWLLTLKIDNVTNSDYETASYYSQDGRNFLATLRYQH